jgi:hypothetical protein
MIDLSWSDDICIGSGVTPGVCGQSVDPSGPLAHTPAPEPTVGAQSDGRTEITCMADREQA